MQGEVPYIFLAILPVSGIVSHMTSGEISTVESKYLKGYSLDLLGNTSPILGDTIPKSKYIDNGTKGIDCTFTTYTQVQIACCPSL